MVDCARKSLTHYSCHCLCAGSELDIFSTVSESLAVDLKLKVDAEIEVSLETILVLTALQASLDANAYATMSAEFKEKARMVVAAYGGDTTKLLAAGAGGDPAKNLAAWIDTVDLNPVPLNATYTHVAELITDPTIAQHVRDHAALYLDPKPSPDIPFGASGAYIYILRCRKNCFSIFLQFFSGA